MSLEKVQIPRGHFYRDGNLRRMESPNMVSRDSDLTTPVSESRCQTLGTSLHTTGLY